MLEKTAQIISSYDGLSLEILCVESENPKGIVQISHGMAENKERYLPLMEFFSEHGYTAVMHDHRGHGKSVRQQEDLGYFYNGKEKAIVEDLHQITLWIKEEYPNLPVYLLGHSMGTLVARNYIKKYDNEIKKLILTGPPCKNPAVDIGLLLAKIQKKIKGDKYRSKEIQKMEFGPFDKIFQGEPKSAWICSDREIVDKYNQSDLCGFTFTTDAFEGLFLLMKGTYSKKGWLLKNEQLPVLFLGGEKDPCIGNGRKFVQEMQFLKQVGYKNVTGKIYSNMRHEILNEKGKEAVYENILSYLEK